ncbi:alpha/beta hydrolase [Hungatella hathewayi]|nr:alpha/beta hydrolase [Hungatella hathewayi]
MKRWNKRLVMLAAAILLMTAGTLLNVAISTNGGNVKVRRVTYSDSYGNMVSGILYIPRTATRETPAPAVLTNHGGGASAEAQSSYNVELARRGYVVLSWDASNSGSSEASPDETHGGEASYAFLQSVDYVQKDQLITSAILWAASILLWLRGIIRIM